MEYTVSEMAEILNLTKANVAYRLRKLGLRDPHDDEHLKAVQNYLVKDKPVTIWQLVVQKYGLEDVKLKYQLLQYRWRKLGKPNVTSLEELDDLWNKHVEERKVHAKEYKEYSKHINASASLVNKTTQKLRHMYDWLVFDPSGVWDDEVREWYRFYSDSGYKACMARRLAYLEVLKQHRVIDTDEYFEAKESKTKLKMVFQ